MREMRIMSMPGSRDAWVALAGPGPCMGPPDVVVIWPLLLAASGSSLLLAFSSTVDILVEKSTLPSLPNLALTQTEMGSTMHAFIITIY